MLMHYIKCLSFKVLRDRIKTYGTVFFKTDIKTCFIKLAKKLEDLTESHSTVAM